MYGIICQNYKYWGTMGWGHYLYISKLKYWKFNQINLDFVNDRKNISLLCLAPNYIQNTSIYSLLEIKRSTQYFQVQWVMWLTLLLLPPSPATWHIFVPFVMVLSIWSDTCTFTWESSGCWRCIFFTPGRLGHPPQSVGHQPRTFPI